eukprot:TRINITY_DN8701_c0_g1_i1.p1 TRINITY_DN8701_c0_g1~~TRINITY_DN8701_c0_g1_i1.p1  ORF type:complete len:339 (-),score=57.88 TRINITY_DN8701_c0_g1_i1:77-1093(-)
MSVDAHLRTIEQTSSPFQERVKAYHALHNILKEPTHETPYNISPLFPRFLSVFIRDITASITINSQSNSSNTNNPNKTSDAINIGRTALRTFGYFVHSSYIIPNYREPQVKEVVKAICSILQSTDDKTICNLCIWCISVQCLGLTSSDLVPLLQALEFTLTPSANPPTVNQDPSDSGNQGIGRFSSSTIEHEALTALSRLLSQLPNDMSSPANLLIWVPMVYRRLLSPTSKVREKAESVLRSALPLISQVPVQNREALQTTLYNDLNKGMLSTPMVTLLESSEYQGKATIGVRVWGYYVYLLGTSLFNATFINTYLQLPEKSFLQANPAVTTSTYDSW